LGQIFTPEWIEQTTNKYNQLPDYQRPSIYFLATTVNGRVLREQIEAWAADLPKAALERMIPKLRSERGFQDTYHELAVGQFLKEKGFYVEYDKNLHGLTPDWYVHQGEHTPPFLVEVLTDGVSETRDERAREHTIADLCHRIEQIRSDVAVWVMIEPSAQLDARQNKRIVAQIEHWLLNAQPPVDSHKTFEGVSVRIFHRNEKYDQVQCLPLREAFFVDKAPLRRKIEKKKVDRYKDLSTTSSLPLVVCVVPTFLTGRSLDTLDDILYGQEAVQTAVDKETGAIVGHRLIRRSDGLFAQLPKLSGVLWFEPSPLGSPQAQYIPNPNALLPLALDMLNGNDMTS
jgi:hypothetical protein